MKPDHDLPMVLRTISSNHVCRVNRAFTEQLGLTAEELEARALLEWVHPEDQEALEQAVSVGEGSACARHRTERGEWVPFDWRVRTEAGRPVTLGLLHGLPEDVKPTPAQPRGLRTTMAETLDAMALIVEAKNPGLRCSILLVDAKREHVTVGAGPSLPDDYNEAVEGLRIGPAVGSCGTAAYWNVPIVVEDIARDPLWRELRDMARSAGIAACWSHPIMRTDGDVLGAMALYASEPSAPTKRQMDGLEIAAHMVGLAIERERLEEQLRQAAKIEALGVLAGGVAHDFNNMLAVVLGYAELAKATLPSDSEVRPMLEEIATASLSASELCNQMLAYAGRGAVTTEALDCNAMVKELGGLLQVALSKKATLEYDLHDTSVWALADRGQLRQVIMNLITNASDAIGNNVGRIVVSTDTCALTREEIERAHSNTRMEPGEYVRIRVRDTGIGMEPKTQARIFDPFFTTKSSGRGLGLAAVRGIVLNHNGTILLESVSGVGTTFTVLLPRVQTPCNAPSPPPVSSAGPPGAHILIVDDEPGVQKVLAETLERAGYKVTCAGDGREAIDVFRRESDSIDCVLLDLSMPRVDGEEAFRELRKIRSDARIILSSGFTEQEIMDRFRGAGLSGALQKPTKMPVLLAKIAETFSAPGA